MKIEDLVLVRRDQPDETVRFGGFALTPLINDDYWAYYVQVAEGQAVVGFPKFGTTGVGFAKEEDWNTNLPYSCRAEEIVDHISHNRTAGGDEEVSYEVVLEAVRMVRAAVAEDGYGPKCISCTGRLCVETFGHWVEDCPEPSAHHASPREPDYPRQADGWLDKSYDEVEE